MSNLSPLNPSLIDIELSEDIFIWQHDIQFKLRNTSDYLTDNTKWDDIVQDRVNFCWKRYNELKQLHLATGTFKPVPKHIKIEPVSRLKKFTTKVRHLFKH